MKFNEKLNEYLNELGCSSKELSVRSEISEAVISRYRSGERTPKEKSDQLKKISIALYEISRGKNINTYSEGYIYDDLANTVKSGDSFDYESFSKHFNELITELKINVNEMAKNIAFDASHLSRIRYGKTRPSDPIEFSRKVCNYIVTKYDDSEDIENILLLLNADVENSGISENEIFGLLFDYLTDSKAEIDEKDYIGDFLSNLDNFNLNDYIKVIKFDKLKVPNIPFYKVKSKNYYGLEGMKNGEIDFFKATVLSKSNEDIFMCSDMPMEDMASDVEFGKKWMFAIAMCLKKGLHLNIIHNLDRPFNEMMLGLESWIPIYMTGQISPYYLKEVKNSVYHHLNYVSGKCALSGECIKGHHAQGKYFLTNSAAEMNYYKNKADLLLKSANPLMDIYNENDKNKFRMFLSNDMKMGCDRKRILNSLPLFTMSDELLDKILKRNSLSQEEIKLIKDYKKEEENRMNIILSGNKITDVIYHNSEQDFDDNNDIYLSLENIFFNKKIKYGYEEYSEHLADTRNYSNENYSVVLNEIEVFRNISISMLTDNYVVISKNSDPVIHFVIKHPKLTSAIRNFNPLVR